MPCRHADGLLKNTHQTVSAVPATRPVVWIVTPTPLSLRTSLDQAPSTRAGLIHKPTGLVSCTARSLRAVAADEAERALSAPTAATITNATSTRLYALTFEPPPSLEASPRARRSRAVRVNETPSRRCRRMTISVAPRSASTTPTPAAAPTPASAQWNEWPLAATRVDSGAPRAGTDASVTDLR